MKALTKDESSGERRQIRERPKGLEILRQKTVQPQGLETLRPMEVEGHRPRDIMDRPQGLMELKWDQTAQNPLDFLQQRKADSASFDLSEMGKGLNILRRQDSTKTSGLAALIEGAGKEAISEPKDQLLYQTHDQMQTQDITTNITAILNNPTTTLKEKQSGVYGYLKMGINAGLYTLRAAKSFLGTAAKIFAITAAFYTLGSVAAAAATAGSMSQFLGTLISLGYGAVSISWPVLGLLTKGLGENLVKSLGTTTTIAGLHYAAKRAGATQFLNQKLNDGYVKSFFVKLGADPNTVTNETVTKELANIFLTAAPALAGVAGVLPSGLFFLAGDPVTALTLNYAFRFGTAAYQKVSLRGAVNNLTSTAQRVKERVASSFINSDMQTADLKREIDNVIKDELSTSELIDTELSIQKAVVGVQTSKQKGETSKQKGETSKQKGGVTGVQETLARKKESALFVPEVIQGTPQSRYLLGAAKVVGLGALAIAFAGIIPATAVATLSGVPEMIASTALSAGSYVAQSQLAQMFVISAVMKQGVGKLFNSIWGDRLGKEEVEKRKQRAIKLSKNYRKAVADGDIKLTGTIATRLLHTLAGFGKVHDVQSISNLKRLELLTLAREMGMSSKVQRLTDEGLRGAILTVQYERLEKLSTSVTEATMGVAVTVASHVVLQGVQAYSSGELQGVMSKLDAEINAGKLADLNAAKAAEAMQAQAGSISAAKEAQKLAAEAANLQKAAEQMARQKAFQDAVARRIAAGKTVGGVTTLASGDPIVGYSFSTTKLFEQIDKEFGSKEFTPFLETLANMAGVKAAGGLLDFVPGMGYLKAAAGGVQTAQYAQSSLDVLEKMAQLGGEGGVEEVLKGGFKQTYASTFEGLQGVTLDNAARLARDNLGEAGAAFERMVSGSQTVKTNLAQGIKTVIADMLKSGEQISSSALYKNVGKLLFAGDVSQQGTAAEIASNTLETMGKYIYESVLGVGS